MGFAYLKGSEVKKQRDLLQQKELEKNKGLQMDTSHPFHEQVVLCMNRFWETNKVQEQLLKRPVAIIQSPLEKSSESPYRKDPSFETLPKRCLMHEFNEDLSRTIGLGRFRMRTGYYPIPKDNMKGYVCMKFYDLFEHGPVEFDECLLENEYEWSFGVQVESVVPRVGRTDFGSKIYALPPFRIVDSYRLIFKIWYKGDRNAVARGIYLSTRS